jgi:hypothetical protein
MEKIVKVHLLFVSSADRITFEEVSERLQCIGEELDTFLGRVIFSLPFLFTAPGSTDLFTWRTYQIKNYKSYYFILFHNIVFQHPVALVCSVLHS